MFCRTPYVIPDLIRDPCPRPASGSARQGQDEGSDKLPSLLRLRGGKTQVTDGPYAEAKELVGGFFIIEAADREEAVRVIYAFQRRRGARVLVPSPSPTE